MAKKAALASFNIGNDICFIPRINELLFERLDVGTLAKTYSQDQLQRSSGIRKPARQRFIEKLLNDSERVDFWERFGQEALNPAREAQFLAGSTEGAHRIIHRWAAKEAAIKAHRRRRLTFHDITISAGYLLDGIKQAPTATIRPLREGDEESHVSISISHDGDYASAVCLAVENAPEVVDIGETATEDA